jgi:hypothetical protein
MYVPDRQDAIAYLLPLAYNTGASLEFIGNKKVGLWGLCGPKITLCGDFSLFAQSMKRERLLDYSRLAAGVKTTHGATRVNHRAYAAGRVSHSFCLR